ncbi:PREDICTED: A-kinase anchor protein 17A-like isoform X2 [Dinoponera quadriceps]|nr:PREDICTED: A-kinase anchor protein 17A-like isoform X2 [Dinoponera quadriceps]XP_014481795.1 PREDICTED: A-kinase anchor protein 17A-like isoform X2 [Dinoponera quadriceps]XP_014481796.1 PREDICTED: A-kinase anchor protein 17A-like isoform X2 [Dinoponera quadriceps]
MEKIRALILPDEFASLKVAKSTLEFIRLEGDLRDRCRLPRVLARLDLQRLKLAGFASVLKVRAAEAKDDFPTRHNWDSYFRDAKHMNELKAGERPDTIHISGLPVKWFTEEGTETPSEPLITKIFSKWGTLRRVDVPAADPYRSRMRLGNNIHKFSYEEGIYFDAYVQYVEYMDFVRAMDAMRGMKLMKKDGQNSLTATIKVDFDKTKHMNDNSVSHRSFERKRLIAQDNLAAEKLRKKEEEEKKRREEQRKKEEADSAAKVDRLQNREEKRKRKALKMFRKQEEDKVSMKIAREEQKLTKAQRQLESIRLLDELFDRIKNKVEKKEIKLGQNMNAETKRDEKKSDQGSENASKDSENDKKNKKEDAKKKKVKKEKKKKKKRKKVQKKRRKDDDSGSGSTSEDSDEEANKKKLKSVLTQNNTSLPTDATLPYADAYDPMQMLRIPMQRYPPMSPGMQVMRIPMSRYPGAQMLRGPMANHYRKRRGRRYFPRCDMGSYTLTNPYLYNEDYYEYFTHIVNQDSKQRGSKSRRKSMSRSASRTKSSSKTRTRSSSRSRSRRRSGSRSRRKSRSSSRSRSRSRRKSKSRSNSRRRTSRSRSKTKRRSASRSRSRRRSGSRGRRRSTRSESRSRTRRSRSKRKSRSRSRSRSRGSSRNRYKKRHGGRSPSIIITRAKSPKRKSSSSSWSLPRSPDRRSSSWSTFEANLSENTTKISDAVIREEPAKTAEAQEEVVTNQQDLKT